MQTFNAAHANRIPAAVAMRGAAASAPRAGASSQGVRRSFERGAEIFAEGEVCTWFYKVVSGTVRTGKLLSDGRRQIDAFHLPGDIFGLEAGDKHRFTAEAVNNVEVIAFRCGGLGSLAQADRAFNETLMSSMLTSLDRAHDHMVLLGRKTALEKMASFLLDLARRLAQGNRVDLPMQRTDIADHLGLTIETVSRTLTQMVKAGLIRLAETGKTIFLADRSKLELLPA